MTRNKHKFRENKITVDKRDKYSGLTTIKKINRRKIVEWAFLKKSVGGE